MYRNGDAKYHGARVIISRKMAGSREKILELITEKTNLSTPARRLCTLQGRYINDPKEIEDGGKYVVLEGSKGFQRVNYPMTSETSSEPGSDTLYDSDKIKPGTHEDGAYNIKEGSSLVNPRHAPVTHAEPRPDDTRDGSRDDESRDGSRDESRDGSRDGSRDESRDGSRDDSRDGSSSPLRISKQTHPKDPTTSQSRYAVPSDKPIIIQ